MDDGREKLFYTTKKVFRGILATEEKKESQKIHSGGSERHEEQTEREKYANVKEFQKKG